MNRRYSAGTIVLGVLLVLVIGACGGKSPPAAPSAISSPSVTANRDNLAQPDAAGTVWLCRPGLPNNPCAASQDATRVDANGTSTIVKAAPATDSGFDCFYVYPTASNQKTDNSDLQIEPAETSVAMSQASRFSQVCQVWAPMYRQRTNTSLAGGLGANPAADTVAYESILSGWQDYLAHYNKGRPIVFIGHSQGAAMLIRLLGSQVDPSPVLRKQLVSAIILGGNVQVPSGEKAGGSFRSIPACQSGQQTGCVIAYSSYLEQPPANSLFGRPGRGVSLQSGQTASDGMQVLCTNPASLAGGPGTLDAFFPATPPGGPAGVTTPWTEFPDLYSAHCVSQGGATWLQIDDNSAAADTRPRVKERLGPTWGLHFEDVGLALGNLAKDVFFEEQAYRP